MSERSLVVPIFVDGLCLSYGCPANGPLADFKRLPWLDKTVDGFADRNSDTPWLGAFTAREPMSGSDAWLPAGVHLHWALPDALCHARSRQGSPSSVQFRPVPDRWLVTRWRGATINKRWLVESNYIWPHASVPGAHPPGAASAGRPSDSDTAEDAPPIPHPDELVSYLLPRELREHGKRPWRFLGRKLDLVKGERPGDPASGRYLSGLTAVGYGEGHFAAYYPSCRSVFGLHDPEITEINAEHKEEGGELRYQVVGWYSLPELASGPADPLLESGAPKEAEPWRQWLRDALGWSVAAQVPATRTLFVATITAAGIELAQPTPPARVSVALAENHVESLSALVVAEIKGEKASEVERLLEGILVADDPAKVTEDDLQPRRFDASMGDPIWAVMLDTESAPMPGPQQLAESPQPSLPADLALGLNLLNDAQRELTASENELAAARQQLHLDWCRYQLYKYPPLDLAHAWSAALAEHDLEGVRRWLEEERLPALAELESELARKKAAQSQRQQEVELALDRHNRSSLGTTESEAPENLQDSSPIQHPQWILRQIQGPSYYTPTQPSVAVLGLGPTDRHHSDGEGSADGTLECFIADNIDVDHFTSAGTPLEHLRDLCPSRSDGPGWRGNPQPHPLFLEWQAQLAPLRDGNSVDPGRSSLDAGFIERHFNLPEGEAELDFLGDHDSDSTRARPIRGRGFMSRRSPELLMSRLEQWLAKKVAEDAASAEGQGPALSALGQWLKHLRPDDPDEEPSLEDARAQLGAVLGRIQAPSDLRLALKAWGVLAERSVITQSLAGFNESLLMLRPDCSLEVGEPLGFDDDRALAERIGRAVQGEYKQTPDLGAPFLPIRTGGLELSELHLVDTWGRPTEVKPRRVATSTRLATTGDLQVALPARIVQPCRLAVRWFDAVHDEQEMGAHPAASPICGWLVPDLLDGSIQVYDASGTPQGAVDAHAAWRPPPGPAGGAVRPLDLPNPHLAKVVEWAVARTPKEMAALIAALESALENIAPAPSRRQEARALLMGRPIAVVRAYVNLELQAPAAMDQSIESMKRLLPGLGRRRPPQTETEPEAEAAGPAPTRAFEKVRFPLRIGEHLRLSDGVVGYFVEEAEGGYVKDLLRAPQSDIDYTQGDHIDEYEAGESLNLWHSLSDPEIHLTLLMDPESALHVTCGILPMKSVRIPQQQYERALKAIGSTFLTAPILSPAHGLELPLPETPGWEWSWVSQEGGRWRRIAHHPTISREAVAAAFPHDPSMWSALHQAGWLAEWPDHPDQARVTDVTRRPALPDELASSQSAIERVLDTAAHSINPPTTDARFAPSLTLREGWLQLSRE